MSERVVMSSDDVRRVVTRLAHEIVERNGGPQKLVLVGIPTRGAPLAVRLAREIEGFEGVRLPLGQLDITLYRDDLSQRAPMSLRESAIPVDITGKRVVIVDDVLYTGRSVRAAMDALIDYGRPEHIRLVALVDRGHRELPIRADVVGKNIPTSRDEEVLVRLREVDGRDEVVVSRSPEADDERAAEKLGARQ